MKRPTTAPGTFAHETPHCRQSRKPQESQHDVNQRVFKQICDVTAAKVLVKKRHEDLKEAYQRIQEQNLIQGFSELKHARQKKDRLRGSPSPAKARRTPQNQVLPQLFPRGFQNQGATCYISATLQCLYRIPVFRTAVLGWKIDNNADMKHSIPFQMKLLFKAMGCRGAPLCTEPLIDAYLSRGYIFNPQQQEDMMVFFERIMNHCFGGLIQRSEFEIEEGGVCGHVLSLHLEVKNDDMSLNDIFRDAMESRNFQKFGNILTIELQLGLGLEKPDFQVGIPLELDAAGFVPNGNLYRLVAVGYHTGTSYTEGHYVAMVQDGDVWMECDDDYVTNKGKLLPICPQGAHTTPRVLFYVKQPRKFKVPINPRTMLDNMRSGKAIKPVAAPGRIRPQRTIATLSTVTLPQLDDENSRTLPATSMRFAATWHEEKPVILKTREKQKRKKRVDNAKEMRRLI